MSKGTVAHELLHALGFMHEQSRPDRDDYVKVYLENVKKGTESNFGKENANAVQDLGTPYDYNSLMHYEWNAFSTSLFKTTIEPLQKGVTLLNAQFKSLSPIDIEEIRKYYNCA
jgi:hypothetical protein